ncbi:MAG: DinB family protein [Dehalococcoidia bacterium]
MSIEEQRRDLHDHYERSRESVLAAIDGLTDDQMTEQTNDGWSVKDHLVHLSVWHEIRRSEIERVTAGLPPAWPLIHGELVDTLNEATVRARREVPLAQVRADLDYARKQVLAAIDRASEGALAGQGFGEAGIRSWEELEHADMIRNWRTRQGY